VEQDVRTDGQAPVVGDEAPDEEGDYVDDHGHAEHIGQQAVDGSQAARPREGVVRQEGFQHVAQVDKEIEHEAPGDCRVQRAGDRAGAEHRALRQPDPDRVEEALWQPLQVQPPAAAPDHGGDLPEATPGQVQADGRQDDEHDFLREGKHG